MIIPELIAGIILIIAGLLVEPFPNLIAGYNTLKKADKEKIDIKRLSVFMRNTLLGPGIVVVLIGIIMNLLEIKPHYSILISSTIIVVNVLYCLLRSSFLKKAVITIQRPFRLLPAMYFGKFLKPPF